MGDFRLIISRRKLETNYNRTGL